MKRRSFLMITGIGATLAALTSFKFVATSYEEAAYNLINDELKYLKLNQEGVAKFVQDYSKEKSNSYRYSIKGYSMLGISSKQSGKVKQLVTAYLLSTNFFSNGMDESKEVKYVGLYNPYLRPCAHPFSHLAVSA